MEKAIQEMMINIALWLQNVTVTFADALALFLPAAGPISDPDFFGRLKAAQIASFGTLFQALAVGYIGLRFAFELIRMGIARDAGEPIMAPGVLFRRLVITVILMGVSALALANLSGAGDQSAKLMRGTVYHLYHDRGGPGPGPLYPDIRSWARNMGCGLTLPQNIPPTGAKEFGSVPCVGVMQGNRQVTLRWLPPDPKESNPNTADQMNVYNDMRVYWIYRQDPDHSRQLINSTVGLTSYTDKNLTNGTQYQYWVGTWCFSCENPGGIIDGGREKFFGPVTTKPINGLLENTNYPAGRIFLNILIALSLLSGLVVILLQTAVRTAELFFAKLVAPVMALSALTTDEFLTQGTFAIWLREVVVLVLSQLTQVLVLCMLVEEVVITTPAPPTFGEVVLALILLGIGTQGPRVLRHFAWSGDNGQLAGASAQVVGRFMRLPW